MCRWRTSSIDPGCAVLPNERSLEKVQRAGGSLPDTCPLWGITQRLNGPQVSVLHAAHVRQGGVHSSKVRGRLHR